MIRLLRVSSRSQPGAVAGAIAHILREEDRLDVRAIGAGAINQSIKSVAIARSYLREDGYDICVVPDMQDVEIEGRMRTALNLSLLRCSRDKLKQKLQGQDVSCSSG